MHRYLHEILLEVAEASRWGATLEAMMDWSDKSAWCEWLFLMVCTVCLGVGWGWTSIAHGQQAMSTVAVSGVPYLITTNSLWTEQAKLTTADAVAHDVFGISVALAADGAIGFPVVIEKFWAVRPLEH
jgi:FG-GAP repeat